MNINITSILLRTCACIFFAILSGYLCARGETSAENGNALPRIFFVSPDGDALADGTSERPYSDIASAINSGRNARADVAMPLIDSSSQAKSGNGIMLWKGLSLKNLTTLGERSATGMDSERGVYVVSVAALGSPFRDFIRPNDVIIGAGDSQVNNLDDLKKALNAIDSTNEFPVVIFRNQKENRILLPPASKH